MNDIVTYLPVLIPLALVQFGLMIWALIHILTHKHYRVGNRLLWVLLALLVSVIGPILYFVLGRSDHEDE